MSCSGRGGGGRAKVESGELLPAKSDVSGVLDIVIALKASVISAASCLLLTVR